MHRYTQSIDVRERRDLTDFKQTSKDKHHQKRFLFYIDIVILIRAMGLTEMMARRGFETDTLTP